MPGRIALAPQWRFYRLVQITGWTIPQIRDTPHRVLEELLMCDELASEVSAEQAERERKKAAAKR